MKSLLTLLLVAALSSVSLAQEKPAPPAGEAPGPGGPGGPGGRPPRPEMRDGPGGPGGPGREGPSRDGPGRDGPGGGGPGGGGRMEVFRGYMELVERYSRLSSSATNSGVAAVITAAEVLRPKGADAVITYFNKVLPNAKNAAVQRAIRLQLVDLYRQSGQADKALEQLETLITGAPEGETASPSEPKH